MHYHVVRASGPRLQVEGATGERVIVGQNIEAGDPILLTSTPLTRPLVDADSGPEPGAERPPKVPNEIDAVLASASKSVARHVERPVTQTDVHPESVARGKHLSMGTVAIRNKKRAHQKTCLGSEERLHVRVWRVYEQGGVTIQTGGVAPTVRNGSHGEPPWFAGGSRHTVKPVSST